MNTTQDDSYALNRMWKCLIDHYGVSEETLKVITNIDGYNSLTLHDVLYAVAGERLFDFDDPDQADNH